MAYTRMDSTGDVSAKWNPVSREVAVTVGTGVGCMYLTVDETHQLMDELRVALRTAAEDEGSRP
ncbi:hypothetical protein [Rhodococcus pyridinivorans]|uniref:Uncharacterized protein n=1 Tax=Rhodococcus pyridinivorans TaxID=103816 RepID=A0A7M2XJ07_9NOCA|nr:hypothetical protein [Rhodococcus pyridinivorans]QOV97637.1 hypothetical protein INP59_17085 [Rhodococcus pyridinivorans]